jgi:hypothetical protein
MPGWDRYGLKKKHRDTFRQTWVLHPVGFVGHIVHCIGSGTQKVDALIFMLLWDRYGFHEKCDGTRYANTCVFASDTDSRKSLMRHVTPNLCFCIR